MVERRLLTQEYVDNIIPPSRGERWIADTSVRGFGLRLWRNGKTGGAAFAVRTTDANGKSFRRTFSPRANWNDSWLWDLQFSSNRPRFGKDMPLGIILEDARTWARRTIWEAKGRIQYEEPEISLEQEILENRASTGRYLADMTLGRAGEIFIQYGLARGWSQVHADRMNRAYPVNADTHFM